MGLRFDIHLHTSRYSKCSKMDANRLIKQAVKMGLDGVVITEHHYIWRQHELLELVEKSNHPGFLLLAGFEYTSSQGDVLVYGLEAKQEEELVPGQPPEEIVARVKDLGAACVAAHPTRAGMGYDERIFTLPLDAMEVRSVNLLEHEQRIAINLSVDTKIPAVTCSDAHRIEDVGRFATEFLDSITTIADLKECLERGRFRPANGII